MGVEVVTWSISNGQKNLINMINTLIGYRLRILLMNETGLDIYHKYPTGSRAGLGL